VAELKIHGLLAALVIPKGETYKENPSLAACYFSFPAGLQKQAFEAFGNEKTLTLPSGFSLRRKRVLL
jgi:hypothetical protein